MNELELLIKKLILEGKNDAEIAQAVVEYESTKSEKQLGTTEAIAKKVSEIKKVEEIVSELKKIADIEAAESAKQAEKTDLDAKVKSLVDEQLEGIKTHPLFTGEKKVTVEDNWRPEAVEGFKLALKVGRKIANSKELDAFESYRLKNIQRWQDQKGEKAIDGVISGTDTAGGFFMPPQFDAEVDKLVFTSSALLSAMKIRQGSEKTEINSIGTFNLAFRTDENTAFGTTKPVFAQQELKYKDAGAIVDIANRALESSYYDIINELVEGGADAKIRLLEPLITTGSVDVDSDAFDGIRFHTGVATLDCANNGGSGKVVSADLTNLYLAAPSQSRFQGSFIMDSREAMVLAEEKDTNGQKLKDVEMVNGSFIHKPTGKTITIVDNMYRTCNGVIDRSTGTDVPVLFGVMPRLRFYQLGGFRIDMSKEFRFDYDATSMRFVIALKFGIPTQSRSSFVTLQGVKYNQVV